MTLTVVKFPQDNRVLKCPPLAFQIPANLYISSLSGLGSSCRHLALLGPPAFPGSSRGPSGPHETFSSSFPTCSKLPSFLVHPLGRIWRVKLSSRLDGSAVFTFGQASKQAPFCVPFGIHFMTHICYYFTKHLSSTHLILSKGLALPFVELL